MDESTSLNNILDAVDGLEVSQDDDDPLTPAPRRAPPPPPPRSVSFIKDTIKTPSRPGSREGRAQSLPRYCTPPVLSNGYYCKPYPHLPEAPKPPADFDRRCYERNRSLTRRYRRSLHLADGEDDAVKKDPGKDLGKERKPVARSSSLRLPRQTHHYVGPTERRANACRLQQINHQVGHTGASPGWEPISQQELAMTPPPPPQAPAPAAAAVLMDREPMIHLLRFLRAFYRELGSRDPPDLPAWAPNLPRAILSPQRFYPALRLLPSSVMVPLDQLFAPIRAADGSGVVSEAPRRILIEGGPAVGKTTLALRYLHDWACGGTSSGGDRIALALLVPLRELRGGSVSSFLSKQLLPRSAIPYGFNGVWKSLSQLEDRLLLILDGYDEAIRLNSLEGSNSSGRGREALGDALDILEGRLFPEARVVLTCGPGHADEVASFVQRRLVLDGLAWNHVEDLVRTYFRQASSADGFLEAVTASPDLLRPLCSWPSGWLMLTVLYDELDGDIPTDIVELYHTLFRVLLRRSVAATGVSGCGGGGGGGAVTSSQTEIPVHCIKLVSDFGKLALAGIREGRFMYTDAEIRAYCHGAVLEFAALGFVCRGLNFGRAAAAKKRADVFTVLHHSLAEFMAAYYLSTIVIYSNIMRRELDDLPGLYTGSQPTNPALIIIRFLMGLLGRRAHLVFSQLGPIPPPPQVLFSLLRAAGASEANVTAVSRLLGTSSAAPSGTLVGWGTLQTPVVIRCTPMQLQGWSHVLRNRNCIVEAVHVELQETNGEGAVVDAALDDLMSALVRNEAVRSIRLSSLLGHELAAPQVTRLAGHVASILAMRKLTTFELVLACVEDGAHDRFQGLVDAICAGLESPSCALTKIVVDLSLDTPQATRLCSALAAAPDLRVVHLPHLGCGPVGFRALASLIRCRAINSLNVAGSWGMRRTESLTGCGGAAIVSSTTTLQYTAKQSTPSYFSSLPRGVAGAHGSLGRPATLPRQPLAALMPSSPRTAGQSAAATAGSGSGSSAGGYGGSADSGYGTGEPKKNSDSVLCRGLSHALPTCDIAAHASSGFHDIFDAVRDPMSQLRILNVSKCLLSAADAACLGETVRNSRLEGLKIEGVARLAEVLPVLVALAEDPALQLLDAASPRLTLSDAPTQLACYALTRNTTLRLLGMDGWTFRLEEEGSLDAVILFLSSTNVRDLVLSNCRLHLTLQKDGTGTTSRGGRGGAAFDLLTYLPIFTCSSVVFLRLSGFQVTVNDRLALRGPALLPFLRGFANLIELDLSVDKPGGLTPGPPEHEPLLIDDKALVAFFNTLSASFRRLQSLRICHWPLSLGEPEKSLKTVGRSIRSLTVSNLKVGGFSAVDTSNKHAPIEHQFLQTLVANMSYLKTLSITGVRLSSQQGTAFGKTLKDRFSGTSLVIDVGDVETEAIRAVIAAAQQGGKVEITLAAGFAAGTVLRVHRVACATKGRGRFRRFTSLRD